MIRADATIFPVRHRVSFSLSGEEFIRSLVLTRHREIDSSHENYLFHLYTRLFYFNHAIISHSRYFRSVKKLSFFLPILSDAYSRSENVFS